MAGTGAFKNSMNGATLPFAVLGIRKDKGQPVQLVNAFESPVIATGKGFDQAALILFRGEFPLPLNSHHRGNLKIPGELLVFLLVVEEAEFPQLLLE